MFVKYLQKVWKSKQLKERVCQQFKKAFLNWQQQCPDEVIEIGDDGLSDEGLVLDSLSISKSYQSDYSYKVEAKYYKKIANNQKVVYILKFWDDFIIYDDVLYTENM